MKRKLALIISICLLIVLASACTLSSSSSGSGASSTGKTINYWAMWSSDETQATTFKAAISRYEKATGNKVVVNWVGRDVRKTLKTALDGNQEIDVVENSPDWLYPNLGTDYLLKIDDYVNKKYATTGDKTLGDTLTPALIDFAKTYSSDGGIYYLPQQPSFAAIFYNKDVFADAGVTSVPTTWAEFLDACEKIKGKGVAPMTVDDAYYSLLYGQYLMMMKGDAWTQELVTDKTGAKWEDPAVLQMAKAFAEMKTKGYFSKNTGANIFPAGQNEVATGTTAMYLNGSWYPNEVSETAGKDFKWGVFAFPNLPGAKEQNTKLGFISQGLAVTKKSKNPAEAAELIAYLLAEETQKELVDKASCIPAINGLEWPSVLSDGKAIFDNMSGSFVWAGGTDVNPDLTPIIQESFAKLLSGSMTPEQFVAEMKSKATK